MTKHFKMIGSAAAAIAAVAVLERLLPAIAAGLVAVAYELNYNAAMAETKRRNPAGF